MFGGSLAGSMRVVLGLDSGRFNRDLDASRRRFRAFGRGVEGDARRTSGVVGRSFRSLARTLGLVFGGVTLAAGFSSAVRSAVSFDKEMRNVNSIAHQSEEQFKKTRDAVLGMAGDVGQAPTVLARGLYDIVSSGFAGAAALKILRVSAKAASAGITDTATASKAVVAALNAYHLPAEKARAISDVLFQIVNKGVITFEELAQNMGDIVPWAAASGVSIQEVGAALSTVTLGGVPAAEAATRVKNTLIQLARPSKELTKLMQEHGFESTQAAIASLGYAGVIELISKATGGALDKTVKLFPEIRAMGGVTGITGKNLAIYNEHLHAMGEASEGAGATQRAFAEQSKSVAVQWQKTKAELEAAAIVLLERLMPALFKGAQRLRKFAEDLRESRGVAGQLRRTVAALANAILRVARMTNRAVQAFGGWEPVIKTFLAFLVVSRVLRFAAAIRAITAAALGARGALLLLSATPVTTGPLIPGGGKSGRNLPKGGGRRVPPVVGFGPVGIAAAFAAVGLTAGFARRDADHKKRDENYRKLMAAIPKMDATALSSLDDQLDDLDSYFTDEQIATMREAIRRRLRGGVENLKDASDRAGATSGPRDAHDRSATNKIAAEQAARDRRKRKPKGTSVKPAARDFELELARARARGDVAGEARILRAQRAALQAEIAGLEQRKKLTDDQRARLIAAYSELESVDSQLEGIQDDRERAQEEAAERRQDKRQAAGKRREKQFDDFERKTRAADMALARKMGKRFGPGFGGGLGAALIDAKDPERKRREKRALEDAKEKQSQAFGREAQFEFLNSLQGITNQFGGNLFPPGTFDGIGVAATHSVAQTDLLRQVNKNVQYLGRSIRTPATRYTRIELGAAGLGVGF